MRRANSAQFCAIILTPVHPRSTEFGSDADEKRKLGTREQSVHGSGDKEGEGKVGKQTAETFYLQKLGKQAQEKRQQEEKSAKQDEQR